MLRKALTVLSTLCLALGGVQGGRGAWIYVKAELAQILLHRAWEQTRAGDARAKPWPWADAWPVARLSLPGRGVDHIVLAGASGRNLAFAPGHLHGSAMPGDEGTCVVAGHRDTHFAILEEIGKGEMVVLERPDGGKAAYRVHATDVVDEHDVSVLADSGGSTLVLVTCWPFDTPVPGGPLRYVVFAEKEESPFQPVPVPVPVPVPEMQRQQAGAATGSRGQRTATEISGQRQRTVNRGREQSLAAGNSEQRHMGKGEGEKGRRGEGEKGNGRGRDQSSGATEKLKSTKTIQSAQRLRWQLKTKN